MCPREPSGTWDMWEKKKDLLSTSSKIMNVNIFHVLFYCKKVLVTSWFRDFLKEFLEDFVTTWFFDLAWKQYFVTFWF